MLYYLVLYVFGSAWIVLGSIALGWIVLSCIWVYWVVLCCVSLIFDCHTLYCDVLFLVVLCFIGVAWLWWDWLGLA